MKNLKEFYRGKKIFITGHTGFKGAWLCKILLNFGSVVAGYSLPADEKSLFRLLNLENQISNHVLGDVRDLRSLKNAMSTFEPNLVIHMAAQPLVIDSYKNPVFTFDTNVMGTVNVLESIRFCNSLKSFLNVTTDKVYENKEWQWGYRENENLCGHDPYSNSKSCSELVTYSYKKSFFSEKGSPAISTARSGNVIGGGDFSENRILPDCIRFAAEKKDILVRNPNSTRPYQHVLECLYGYLLLLMKQYYDKEYEGCYNFGPNEESCVTTGELASIFCKIWGEDVSWFTKNEDGVHEANFLKLDCSKSKHILGWSPNWCVEKAVEMTVSWEKDHRKKLDMNRVMDEQIKEFFNRN